MVISLNLQIAFGKIAIFTVLILPIHEHERSFHLLRSSLISFFRDLKFSFFPFFICDFLHLHFQCYPKSPPYPPPTTPLLTHSHFLALVFPCTEAYKVCKNKGPLFPLMANQGIFSYICRLRHDLRRGGEGGRGYWLLHIVVPPRVLQIPLAPWVLSLAPPLGAL